MFRRLFISALCLSGLATAQEPQMNMDPYTGVPRYANPACYTYDFHVTYGFKASPDHQFAPETVGAELGWAFYFTPRQAVTLTLSGAGGSSSRPCWYEFDNNYFLGKASYDRADFSLMPGYRFSQPIGRYLSFTVGAKCGLDIQHLSVKDDYRGYVPGYGCDYEVRGTKCGFGYAGYAEIGVLVSDHSRIVVGYQYHGATTKPVAKDNWEGTRYSAKDIRWHEVRVGLDVQF